MACYGGCGGCVLCLCLRLCLKQWYVAMQAALGVEFCSSSCCGLSPHLSLVLTTTMSCVLIKRMTRVVAVAVAAASGACVNATHASSRCQHFPAAKCKTQLKQACSHPTSYLANGSQNFLEPPLGFHGSFHGSIRHALWSHC